MCVCCNIYIRTCLQLVLLLLALLAGFTPHIVEARYRTPDLTKGKICIGTNGRMSVPANRTHHYRNLRVRYTNCTYVDGNLELTWLDDQDFDLSFLKDIREVTGYVLISHVNVDISLPSLQIIRGQTLFKLSQLSVQPEEFALFITHTKMRHLEMPALSDILHGSVGDINNVNLCYLKTINWKEILTGPDAKLKTTNSTWTDQKPRACPPCHKSCESGCWGPGERNCQKFSKINCSPQCAEGRCFGPKPRNCCHLFCAGGCVGPRASDCKACKNFYDDGVCKQECPQMQTYNPSTYSWETNPNGKYAYGATCVKQCPEHLLKDNGACVRACPKNKHAVDGECVPCDGPCPKTCESKNYISAKNIDSFVDCTVIEGHITILDTSFSGYVDVAPDYTIRERIPPMHPDKLEVFSTVKEVTEFINIQGNTENFTNLSYFRNLEIIGGRQVAEYFSSLFIVKSSLISLNLKSLQTIRSGKVTILENKDLCFAEDVNWELLMVNTKEQGSLLQNNRPKADCTAENLICDKECTDDGCWGIGADQCVMCAHFKFGDTCISSCGVLPRLYKVNNNTCAQCHEECETCYGPGADKCHSCKNAKDQQYCVAKCPALKYYDNGICKPCHKNCVEGCGGPENTIGPLGCKACEKALVQNRKEILQCLPKSEDCPQGYYLERTVEISHDAALAPLDGYSACHNCHDRCITCTNYGFHIDICQQCKYYRHGEQCEERCPMDFYPNDVARECTRCADECSGCTGPLPSDCINCRNYRIFSDDGNTNTTHFNCTRNCTSEYPHRVFPEDGSKPYCTKNRASYTPDDHISAVIGGVLACVFLLGVFVVMFIYHWRQRARAKENALKMTMVMAGCEDIEPLHPTNIRPNLAKLRIVKEAELRTGGILGYGAFGTVYKGVWVPEGENVKIPVAIKVLREGSGNRSKEILEEAYIMASVEHPHLLQLLAVCMTSQIMLVTQLMPLGCLLDYVRNNKDKIGSKPLLNWCTQIAKGMAYLEERRLVHRDLAARNVLVQTPSCVRITDFGLAKLLDYNEEEYKAAGGKMPIKWLALECIQHRIFTHKSDVWAFGVTVWELLTYGGRPYEGLPAREVPELLEKGERLPQPPSCTIDVYMIMIKCWMLDAEGRPSFKELAEEFAKMARDPGRYLVIQGDKFMRLPSYTPQDQKELIRNLSAACDGPEVIMDAEEYLQPKNRTHAHTSLTGDSPPPTTPIKKVSGSFDSLDFSSSQAASPQNWQNMNRERKYNQALVNGVKDGSVPSLRYCSDPLKMIDKDVVPPHEGGIHSDISHKPNVKVAGMNLCLPVDDDDYLVPSPSMPSNAYMDLIGDTKPADCIDGRYGYNPCAVPDFIPVAAGVPIIGLDNPEYHIMAQQHGGYPPPSIQTVGLPDPATYDAARQQGYDSGYDTKHRSYNNNNVAKDASYPTQQRSSEEESDDHEYYNDMDRLQRELQPLKPFKRSETTV